MVKDGWEQQNNDAAYYANAERPAALLLRIQGGDVQTAHGLLVEGFASLKLAGGRFPVARPEDWVANGWGGRDIWPDLRFDESRVLQFDGEPEAGRIPVTGSIDLRIALEGLVLRPHVLGDPQDREGEYVFEEQGERAGAGAERLSVTIAEEAGRLRVTGCSIAAVTLSPFLDRLQDGGWERPPHLWMAGVGGDLRVASSGSETEPYGRPAGGESRIVDLSGALPALPPGARLLLLLDASGHKTLWLRPASAASLEVEHAALLFVLPATGLDARILPDPTLPPAAETYAASGSPLYLVSPRLVGRSLAQDPARFQVNGGTDKLELELLEPAAWRWFGPSIEGFVFPPEYAANGGGTSISPSRVKAAHLLPANAKLALTADGLSVPAKLARDGEEIARHAPLPALAWDGACTLWRGKKLEKFPLSVLHYGYRDLVDSGGRAPLAGTLALRTGEALPAPAAQPVVQEIEDTTRATWFLRPRGADPRKPQFRHDALALPPRGKVGWENEAFEAAPADTRGAQWTKGADAWVRLPNWALLHKPAQELRELAAAAKPVQRQVMLGAADGSLHRIVLQEDVLDGTLEFFLRTGDAGVWKSLGKVAAGNKNAYRAVVACAGAWRAAADAEKFDIPLDKDDNALRVRGLNRVFIEVERVGVEFRVLTAMMGWDAAEVFGIPTEEMHVTEYFHAAPGGKLQRVVELNGSCVEQPTNNLDRHRTQLYFWSAAWTDESTYLRLACKHTVRPSPATTASFVSIHDARVVGARLDYSSDIAVVDLAAREDLHQRGAEDPWKPARRNLFSFVVGTSTAAAQPLAFVSVRRAATGDVQPMTKVLQGIMPYLIPAWQKAKTELVAWLAPGGRVRRPGSGARDQWLPGRLLRTERPAAGGDKLRVGIVMTEALFSAQRPMACTLAAPDGAEQPPQWVPSLITGVKKGSESAGETLQQLWIFDPRPRVLATRAADDKEAPDAWARRILRISGWRREAVLEQPGPPATWTVIDSPLLNESTDPSWFGWPLTGGGLLPNDDLPATEQVRHVMKGDPGLHSLRVPFEQDVREGTAGKTLRTPVLFNALPRLEKPVASAAIRFVSRGLRPGVVHQVSSPGNDPAVFVAGVPPGDQGTLVHSDGLLRWDTREVEPRGVGVPPAGAGVDERTNLLLSADGAAAGAGTATFTAAPVGLQVQRDNGNWETVKLKEAYPVASAGSVPVRLNNGTWSTIRMRLVSGGVERLASFFDDPQPAVCGVFVEKLLVAFGEETVLHRRNDGKWSRFAQLAWPQAAAAPTIVQISARGRTTRYLAV